MDFMQFLGPMRSLQVLLAAPTRLQIKAHPLIVSGTIPCTELM